jgi:cell division protein FtsQ
MKKKGILRWLWALLPLVVAAGFLLTLKYEKEKICTSVAIETENDTDGSFMTKEDIYNYLFPGGDHLVGKNVNRIDVTVLENKLMQNPYVYGADAYVTPQGVLKIRVQQRKPIARIFDPFGKSVYLSSEGILMPASEGINRRIMVVSGILRDTIVKYTGKSVNEIHIMPVLKEVYATAAFLDKDTVYSSLTGQIYINEDQELELISTMDDHTILIGNADNLEWKFKKLMAFYKKGMPRIGWDVYSKINLKYSNQVVCTTK